VWSDLDGGPIEYDLEIVPEILEGDNVCAGALVLAPEQLLLVLVGLVEDVVGLVRYQRLLADVC
jgi:hypothetical protein